MMKFIGGASVSALAIAIASPVVAQDASTASAPAQGEQQGQKRKGGVRTIVVTAQRRSEDLQDVPVAVNAIGAEELDELNIQTFDDYLEQLPNVTAGGAGPGQRTIYIRGIASTTPNLGTSGVAGLAPNVAFYLDEQPLAQPGRNLDVYAADLARIEVLSGPQGTLFGASSQAGTVRLITNKPELGVFSASADAGVSFTKGGETNYNGEFVINVPVTDNIAVRGVAFFDDQGGYIDNVPGTRSLRDSGRFRPEGTVRDNGVPVNAFRAGVQSSPEDLAFLDNEVTFLEANNANLVEDNFNDTQYTGFRATVLWEPAPDWTVTVAHTRQSLESDGVFFADPELGLDDLEIQRFENDRLEDDFSNTAWTVEGRIGALELVYTGAYTSREAVQTAGYSDYLFVGQYAPYYSCDAAVTYNGADTITPIADPTCYAPNFAINADVETRIFTQELRLSTPQDAPIRATGGAFYSDLELDERVDFAYSTPQSRGADGVTRGFLPTYPFTNTSVTGEIGNALPGFFSDPGPFPDNVGFRNDVRRTDEQFGLFGQVSLDVVPDLITVTGGLRYYDVVVDLVGSATPTYCNRRSPATGPNVDVPLEDRIDVQGCGGSNLDLLYGPDNPFGNPDRAETSGFIFKGTVEVTPTPDTLIYATYSEGFRPGLLNRPGGAPGPGDFVVPFELETDEVANYELGWKLDLVDGQVRFNGAAFFVDITNLQTTIFDPAITNLFFSANAANAEIYGLEADFVIAPYSVPGLTVAGAISLLDTEITEVLVPTNDVLVGEDLAFAPDFQGNLRVRYEFALTDELDAYVMPQVTYSGSKFTDVIEINKIELDSYTIVDFSAGIAKDSWNVEVFADNVFDERAQISGTFIQDRRRIVTNRPLTIGMRVGYDF